MQNLIGPIPPDPPESPPPPPLPTSADQKLRAGANAVARAFRGPARTREPISDVVHASTQNGKLKGINVPFALLRTIRHRGMPDCDAFSHL